MIVKNKYNHWLPRKLKAGGVTIGRTIYYRASKENVPESLRVHENVHIEQYKEYGVVLFLMIYFYHYLKGRLKGLNHWEAYRKIPFEIEAYAIEDKFRAK